MKSLTPIILLSLLLTYDVTAQTGGQPQIQPAPPASPAGERSTGSTDLKDWKIEGDVTLDATHSRNGKGASMKIGPGGKATRIMRPDNASGRVTFWIYDDKMAPEDVTQKRSGPSWGIVQSDGSMLLCGIFYSSRLLGDVAYSLQHRVYLEGRYRIGADGAINTRRNAGWRKWEFVLDPEKRLTILVDDVPAKISIPLEDQLIGFSGIVIIGDDPKGDRGQSLWVEDMTAEMGSLVKIPPLTVPGLHPPSPSPDPSSLADVIGQFLGQKPKPTETPKPAEPVKPEVPDGTLKVQDTTYLVTTEAGSGSAFLARMGGKVYAVTNYHVVKGASQIDCANPKDSFKITGAPLEVADDRDLVRFPVDKKEALDVNASPALDMSVAAYGNSGGKNVVTKLPGKVLGVGPDEVEVSCEFIPGNSGGPIADDDGNVVGVSTYVATEKGVHQEWITKGTRFEGTRRFGVRLSNDIAWSAIDLAQFQKETKTLVGLDGVLEDLSHIFTNFAHAPFEQPLVVKYATGEDITNFVALYNHQCKELSVAKSSSYSTQALDILNRQYHAKIGTNLTTLAHILDSTANDISWRYQNQFTIPHTKKDCSRIVADMREMSEYIKANGTRMTPADFFHFKRPGDKP